MAEWFESGLIYLVIVAIVAVEGLLLTIAARRSQRALSPTDVLFQLSAGAFLLLAVRSAALDQPWTVTAAFVTASLPVHVIDLYRRWVRS